MRVYASIPFHALAAAHTKLLPHLEQFESGYLSVNYQIISHFNQPIESSK